MKENNKGFSDINTVVPRILIYQNDDYKILVDYLIYSGFQVIVSTEKDILSKIREKEYDLCILDHCTEKASSDLKLLKFLRKTDNKIPVIMLSDKAQYNYIIKAFDEGADDYVIRPYNIEEFVRRLRAVLKRCGIRTRTIDLTYKIGKFLFDTVAKTLTIENTEIKLNNKHSQILALLSSYKNEILPKQILLQKIWADDNYFNKRSLDVHICTLRSILKADNSITIETHSGIGYALIIKKDET